MADGAACFGGGFSGPPLLRVPAGAGNDGVRVCHPLRTAFPGRSPVPARPSRGPYNPGPASTGPVWASPAFARHYRRDHCCLLFLRVLRCFSSPGSPPCGWRASGAPGCPIRAPADQGPCAAPRGFSQLTAPFLASESLGIPRAPLSGLRRAARPDRAAFPLPYLSMYRPARPLPRGSRPLGGRWRATGSNR